MGTLFSLVFPLAPFMGFFLLTFELRIDGFKLFTLKRRPMPVGEDDIGAWYIVLSGLSWIAMFTNAALIVFTFGVFDHLPSFVPILPDYVYFAFLVICFVSLKVGIALIVPDVPHEIEIAEEHQKWVLLQVDEALLGEVDAPKDPVDLLALDLHVDDSHTGELRNPIEFGIRTSELRHRIKRMRKHQLKKDNQI